MTNPVVDNTPSGVTIWIEQYVRSLAGQASHEVLEQHLTGLSPEDVQLRLMFLAQMVASNTTTEQRKAWTVKLITDMARHFGVDLD